MSKNLVAELIRKGIPTRLVAKEVAKATGISEKTARNKINGRTDWTVPEAMRINDAFFDGTQRIEQLFARQ